MSIESKVYLDIARIWNLGTGEVEKMVRDYIGAVTCDFNPLKLYPKPRIDIRPVKIKTLKERLNEAYYQKEDDKMKATSVQNIKNVKDICVSTAVFPMGGPEETLTIRIHTDDDIFEFNFEGPDLVQKCKKSGLFSGWEKEQKIRKLEKELNEWKKEAADCLKLRDEAQKEAYKLKKENEELQRKYNLERAANEAHHRFFHQYAGKGTEIEFNYAIDEVDEVTYVIVDKDRYRTLKAGSNIAMIHGKVYNAVQLVDRILELEQLKTPTVGTFAVEEFGDNVNHPSHYTGKYECIDVMQDVFGDEATNDFCLCNAFKYIWRARKKNGLEDVKKAVWYLNKYIEEAEKDGEDKVTRT